MDRGRCDTFYKGKNTLDSVIGPFTVSSGRGDEDQDEVYISLEVPC